ncbi:hypothetical protein FJW08_14755 [Mesorhizobium sp. B3-2-1]|nr:hypothetical protein FJW08_14755 [Mesorhizobium sp. B3-2-1]
MPDISPTRGEISGLGAPLDLATSVIGESFETCNLPLGGMSGRTEGGAKDRDRTPFYRRIC